MFNSSQTYWEYNTKVSSILITLLMVGFSIVSYSLNFFYEPLFLTVFSIFLIALIWVLGVSYRISKEKLVISKFNITIKTIELKKLNFMRLLSRQFALPIYNNIPMFFWGINGAEKKQILDKINSVINQPNEEEFKIICSNKKLLIEIIQNIFLVIVLFVSAYRVRVLYSSDNEIVIYIIVIFLILTSLWKAKKIEKTLVNKDIDDRTD